MKKKQKRKVKKQKINYSMTLISVVKKINKSIFIFFLTISFVLELNAQRDNIIKVKRYPVRSGYIKVGKETLDIYSDFSGFINIYSEEPKIFSLRAGKVLDILTIDNTFYVRVQANNNKSIIYGNLKTVNVSKGDLIKRGKEIGVLKMDANYQYILDIGLMNGLQNLSYQEHLDMFNNRQEKMQKKLT